jgi:hypothetical protein
MSNSVRHHAATRRHGFRVIGLRERNRNRAFQIEPGDRIVLYAMGVKAFVASMRVEGELHEDRSPLWPGIDEYPWRFECSPEIVLDEAQWVAVEPLAGELEHVRKWPRKYLSLAFQGQIRPVSARDGALLVQRLATARDARAPGRSSPERARARA